MANQSIYIVIVLYKMKLESCVPFQFLMKNIHLYELNYNLLIYNNYDEITILPDSNYIVFNASQNDMLAEAYNYALKQAMKKNINWLLLLDQDTELTGEYFDELHQILNSDISTKVGAIIPQIEKNKHFITPKTYLYKLGSSFFVFPVRKSGIYKKCFLAINSGAVLNVNAMHEIGGFPKRFPLDGLDSWYFSRLHKNGNHFYVMNSILEQNLSILDCSTISVDRYKSILKSDLQFNRELGFFAVFLWKIKIPLQVIKRMFYKDKRRFTCLTLSFLFK